MTYALTVAGDVASFDQEAFKATFASTVLGGAVSPKDITLTVKAGSVSVDATIRAASQDAAGSLASTLGTLTPNALSTQLSAAGVTVEAVTPPIVGMIQVVAPSPSPPPPPPSPTPSSPAPSPPTTNMTAGSPLASLDGDSVAAQTANDGSSSGSSSGSGIGGGAIAGIVIAVLLALGLGVGIAVARRKGRLGFMRKRGSSDEKKAVLTSGEGGGAADVSSLSERYPSIAAGSGPPTVVTSSTGGSTSGAGPPDTLGRLHSFDVDVKVHQVGVTSEDPEADHKVTKARLRQYELEYEAKHGVKPRKRSEWGEMWPEYERYAVLRKMASDKKMEQELAELED